MRGTQTELGLRINMSEHILLLVTPHTDPLVMRLVQALIEDGVVQPTVDPIDAVICEDQEAIFRQPRAYAYRRYPQ